MKSYNIIIFPIGGHDLAGNKRLSNLKDYLGAIDNTNVKIVKIKNERTYNSNSSLVNLISKFLFSLFRYFWVIWLIFHERKRGYINVLYFYEGNNFLVHRILLAKLLGYKILLDLVENPDCVSYVKSFTQKLRSTYFLILYRFLPYISDGIIVVSKYLENKIILDFNNKISVFHMPVSYNPDNFKGEPYDFPQFSIFYGGSYGENYDFNSLINAFNNLGKEYPGLKLYLSGNIHSSKLEIIRNMIVKKDNLVYLGYLKEDEYFKVICGIDILCMPRNNSIQSNSGFPFKLAEYLATGKPVITSNISDVLYYLSENDAYIYEPGDSMKIELHLRQIFSDYEKALMIGKNGMKKAEMFFNSRKLALNFHNFLVGLNF
jgi:glycosyltransferase involved in cell wall biosynthesis